MTKQIALRYILAKLSERVSVIDRVVGINCGQTVNAVAAVNAVRPSMQLLDLIA